MADLRAQRLAGLPEREALEGALAVWRLHRAGPIADAIDRLSARVALNVKKPQTKEAFQRLWFEIASKDPSGAATAWLAENLVVKVPVDTERSTLFGRDAAVERYGAFLDRVSVLAERPAHPAVAKAALEVLTASPWTILVFTQGAVIYGPVIALLQVHFDPRLLPLIEAQAREPRAKATSVRDFLRETLPAALRAMQGRGEALAAHEEASWDQLGVSGGAGLSQGPRPDPRDVLEAIHEDPADEGLRAVYAEILQSGDDPRGEFVALQLRDAQGFADEKQRKRMRQLLKTHGKDWLGPDLSAVLKGPVWRRGFIDETELAGNSAAEATVWARAARDPRLATLRVLWMGQGNREHYGTFLTSPATTGLEVGEIPVQALGERLAAGPPKPRLRELWFHKAPPVGLLKTMAAGTGLPALTTFGVLKNLGGWQGLGRAGGDLETLDRIIGTLVDSGWAPRVEGLGITVWPVTPDLSALWSRLGPLPALQKVELRVNGASGATFYREGGGWRGSFRTDQTYPGLLTLFRPLLPSPLVAFDLDVPDELRAVASQWVESVLG